MIEQLAVDELGHYRSYSCIVDMPYLLLKNYLLCLAISLIIAVMIIAIYNDYFSAAKGKNFRLRFMEMTSVSLGVALFSHVIGFIIRHWLGVDV